MKTIPIFFTVDNAYAPLLSIAIASLIENTSKNYNYNIHIIDGGFTKESKEKLSALEKENVKIIFNEISKDLELIQKRNNRPLDTDFFSLITVYRLFIPFMFPEYDKGIYIDSDTVVLTDIAKLYEIDLEDNLFGGCNDISCADNEILCEYFENNAGVNIKDYINSGVLLMNMKELRNVNFEGYFLYLLNKYHFENVCPDQDYINAIAKGRIKHLDNRWDAMPSQTGCHYSDPYIVHYNLFYKPWNYDGIEYEEYFWKYANKSPFKEEIYKEKNEHTLLDKETDKKMFDELIKRAKEISESETTFKKVFESGKEIPFVIK